MIGPIDTIQSKQKKIETDNYLALLPATYQNKNNKVSVYLFKDGPYIIYMSHANHPANRMLISQRWIQR